MTDLLSWFDGTWSGRRVLVLSPIPTDAFSGGRASRIHFLCHRLKDLGAKIHFLYCPSRDQGGSPAGAADCRAMMETWDACYLSPANRPNPGNEAQTVDERWDSGIEASLEWLFHVDTFDVFIVVFPWLSKAFESTPAGVLKVLDIQDIRDWTRIPDSFAEPFQPDADVVRMVCARADVIWTPDQELTTRLSELCDATTLTVPHAEPVRAGWPRPRSEILRFGLVCSDESGDVEDIHGFLNVAETFIRDRLLPCEIVIGGPFCDLFSALDYPFLRVLDPSLPLDDFYRSVDVVLVLAESPTDQQIHAAGAMSRGKAVLCRSHFAGNTPPAHAFHELPSFEAMMRACRQIVGAAGLIDDLEAASIESMKRAARSVEYALHASLPARRNLPSGFVFVVASNALQDHGLVLDHICDAAHYVGCQSDVLFLVLGTVGDASRRAIRRLAALGRVILTEPPTVTGTERLPQPVFSLCVASYEEVLQSGQTAFWFTCPPPPRQTIAAPLPVTAFFPISVLAQTIPEPSISGQMKQWMRSFARTIAMDTTPSRLLSTAAAKGMQTHLVPFLWRAEGSRILELLNGRRKEFVTFLVDSPGGVTAGLAVDIALNTTSCRIDVVYDDHGEKITSPEVTSSGRLLYIPASRYWKELGRRKTGPRIFVQIGNGIVFNTFCELADRAGIPRIALFDGAALRPVVAGRDRGSVSGMIESALVLAEILIDDGLADRLCEGRRHRFTIGDDSGWTIVWNLVSHLLRDAGEARRTDLPLRISRELKAEVLVQIQDQGTFRSAMQDWIGIRGENRCIEAFGIRPLEALGENDIEYKALGPGGRETSWVSNSKMCGTRGRRLPLTGFAIRLAPHLRGRYDVVYEGSFAQWGMTESRCNGEFCTATVIDSPLEAIRIRLLDRSPPPPEELTGE